MLHVQMTPVLLVSIYGLDDSSLFCSEYWLKVRLEEFVDTRAGCSVLPDIKFSYLSASGASGNRISQSPCACILISEDVLLCFLWRKLIFPLSHSHIQETERGIVVHVGKQFKDHWEGKPTLYEEGLGTGNPAGKGS